MPVAGKAPLVAALALIVIAGGSLAAYKALVGPSGQQAEEASQAAEPSLGVQARLEVDDGILDGREVIVLGPEDARIYIYFFYDLYCPYCAMEMVESADYYAELASKYKVILVDFIVHEQGLEGHALLRCAAKQGAPILDVLSEWYEPVASGERPGIDKLRDILAKYGVNPDEDCASAEKDRALEISRLSAMLGVRGTPTVAIYDSETRTVLNAAIGYMGEEELRKFIESSIPSTP